MRWAQGARGRAAVALVVMAVAAVVAVRQRGVVAEGVDRLAAADRGWLLVAGTSAVLTWGCSALALQGAVRETLPAGRLLAGQFAASAANHVLPSGLGAGAVNVRLLQRCGLSLPRAASALAVKTGAGGAVRGALLAVLALSCPGVLTMPESVPWLPLAGVCVAGAAVVPLRGRVRGAAARVLADVRDVHQLPNRAAALWGGSLAFALLHATVLIALTRSLDVALPAQQVALAYLAASSAAVLLPTPGNLGSLDAALLFALVAAGAPGSAAGAAVIGYRLFTAWLPLVPGLAVLVVLVRRRIV
ncbi:lysylphosphatidylglycerol synthase transmembrane domain-containing protein [Actinomycetota bacterium Odt1-20B]